MPVEPLRIAQVHEQFFQVVTPMDLTPKATGRLRKNVGREPTVRAKAEYSMTTVIGHANRELSAWISTEQQF